MTVRDYIYNTLTNDVGVNGIAAGRVYASESLMTTQLVKPFIVYRLSANPEEAIFDDPDIPVRPNRQFFQVWAHDSRPDYTRIDSLCDLVKQAFRTTPTSPSDSIIWTTYLDRSDDFDDVVLDTVFRYLRFQSVLSQ